MKTKLFGIAMLAALGLGTAQAHTTITGKVKIGIGHKYSGHSHTNHNHGHNGHQQNHGRHQSRHNGHQGRRHNNGHNNGYYNGHRGHSNYRHAPKRKADLVVRTVRGHHPRYSHRHGGYVVMVKVKNVGNKRSQGTSVRVTEKGHSNNRVGGHVSGLAPGQATKVRLVLPRRPRYGVKVRVNPRNQARERNYRNNGWVGRI